MARQSITIQDIANKANVSKATVSRVINNRSSVHKAKRKAVLAAMKELGFQPNVLAQSLAGGNSKTIGVVIQMIGSPFSDTVTQGIIDALDGTGYFPIISDGKWEQRVQCEAIETLLGRRVDGLILVGGNVSESYLDTVRETIPVMIVGTDLPGRSEECVCIDNAEGAFKATTHLIEMGHTSIAHIRGIQDQADAVARVEGYTHAIESAGLTLDPDLIVEGDFSAQSGVIGVNLLLSRGKSFTAIFAANDMSAMGARLALYQKGIRVPDDVSIVGFDDQEESAFMVPPITTVRQPASAMGKAAGTAMLNVLKGKPIELPKLSTELVVRESVSRRK